MFQPQPQPKAPPAPQPNTPQALPSSASPQTNMAPTAQAQPAGGGNEELQLDGQEAPTPEEISAHLDSLADDDKKFLAEHLTPEFVRAISLISGPEVGQYLDQFADKSKVLVPVPRQVAEQYLAEQNKAQQSSESAPQGGTPPSPAASQGAPAQQGPAQAPSAPAPQPAPRGMMAPSR